MDSRIVASIVVLALAVAACGAAPDESVDETRPPETTSTTIAPIDLEPEERIALAAETITNVDTFRYEIDMEVTADSELAFFDNVTIAIIGAIDVPRDRSYLRIDGGDVWTGGEETLPSFSEEIRIGETLYERGFGTTTMFIDDPDYDAWYVAPAIGSSAADVIAGVVQGPEIADVLAAADTVDELGTETRDGVSVTHLRAEIKSASLQEIGEKHPNSIADLSLGPGSPPATYDVWIDDDGITHRLLLTATSVAEGNISYVIDVQIFAFGEPVDIEAPENAIEPPPHVDALFGDVTTEIRPQEDGTMFRLNIHQGDAVQQLTVEEDGRVVLVTDTSVLATPDAYTTWTISPVGVERLVAAIEDSGLLDHPEANLQFGPDTDALENSASIFYNDCCVLGMDGLGREEGFTDEQLESRIAFELLVAELRDLSWIGDEVLTAPEPFVPEGLTLMASQVDSSLRATVPWPLADGIAALAIEPAEDLTGAWQGLPVCLYGADAAAVFALTDTQGTTMTIDDGTGLWDVFIRVHLPGYRLYGDPCP